MKNRTSNPERLLPLNQHLPAVPYTTWMLQALSDRIEKNPQGLILVVTALAGDVHLAASVAAAVHAEEIKEPLAENHIPLALFLPRQAFPDL